MPLLRLVDTQHFFSILKRWNRIVPDYPAHAGCHLFDNPPPHIRPAKFTPVIIISYNNEQTIYFYYSTQLIVYYNWIRNSIQFYLAP